MTRVAVVAGTGDTGLAAALHLAGLGFDIALIDADADADADANADAPATTAVAEAAERIRAGARRCVAVGADVADSGSVHAALDRVRSELGSPSVLLNCVRLGSPEPLSAEERYAEVRRSLRAVFVCCRAVAGPMVRGRWGRIVTIAQPVVAGPTQNQPQDQPQDRQWRDGQTVLGGLAGFTRSAALELAAYGITANYIAPSSCYPAGPAHAPAPPLPAAARGASSSYSEGVASLTGFLISDQASAITGQGGYLAGRPAAPSASGE